MRYLENIGVSEDIFWKSKPLCDLCPKSPNPTYSRKLEAKIYKVISDSIFAWKTLIEQNKWKGNAVSVKGKTEYRILKTKIGENLFYLFSHIFFSLALSKLAARKS